MSDITPESAFERLKENTVHQIQGLFPVTGKWQELRLNKIWVDDDLHIEDLNSQMAAKDYGRTWGVPIKADVSLVDVATGKVIDHRKDMTLGKLPKLTNRYGYIVNGNEYQVDTLFRLKSGVYARVHENGDLATEFNLSKKPTGTNFSVELSRKGNAFSLKQGGAHIPLYPLLKILGRSDDEIEGVWGKDLFNINKVPEEKFQNALHQFWSATAGPRATQPKDLNEYSSYVHKFFDQTGLLPDSTKITLGKPFSKVDGETLLLAANKILGVRRGTVQPDNRDSLLFKEVASVEDFVPEQINRSKKTLTAILRQHVDQKKKISDFFSVGLLNKPIEEVFTKSTVSERGDQTNPITMLSSHSKTTLVSKTFGGLKNERSITQGMRDINPTTLGFLDSTATPESGRTGVTVQMASGARKNGRDLEAPVYQIKSGKIEYLKVFDFNSKTSVMPDQVTWKNGKPIPIAAMVKAKMPGGEIKTIPFKEADCILPSSKGFFSHSTNLIPFLPCDQGGRVLMANKQLGQAIPLLHREAPLVQTKTDSLDPNQTNEKMLGRFSSTHAKVGGTVVKVEPTSIVIKGDDKKEHIHQIYDHFPLNDALGMITSSPNVKVGDSVKKGQLLADSNFTKNGTLAIGTSLRVGYMPYKGYNFEDGIVISQSAAEKMTSVHLHKMDLEIDPELDKVNRTGWRAFNPRSAQAMTKEQWSALDDDGVIKVGTHVAPGQLLIAAYTKNIQPRKTNKAFGNRDYRPYKDKSLVWNESHAGEVIRVVKNPSGKGIRVYVKTLEPMVVGDKMAARHGDKGIVTQILPDHEMPFTIDKNGERHPLQVLLNPTGVITRINPGQILETAAGKVAEKTGKTYIVDNFDGAHSNYREQVEDELKQHGLSDLEPVFDPDDPKKILGQVLVGPKYMLKLSQQIEKKLHVRGGFTDLSGHALPNDLDRQPSRGGHHGGQGFGQLDMYALLGHGALHNIREFATNKSDAQDEHFWARIQRGQEPPPPQPSFVYNKFLALLTGLGVNVVKEGSTIRMVPMGDKAILKMADNGRNEIKEGHLIIRAKDQREEKDGLFDPNATGGKDGTKWSFIRLAEPMPNPLFVGQGNFPGPVPVLLGLKMDDVDAIMNGHQTLEGKSGGVAFESALRHLDTEAELHKARALLKTERGAALDRANKKVKMLLALKDSGLSANEAYMMKVLPVIPPQFRPITSTPSGDVHLSPINTLYKNLSIYNRDLKEFPIEMEQERKNPLRASAWDSLKALQSIGNYKNSYDIEAAGEKRRLKGILDTIGNAKGIQQPKESLFQSKLVKRRLNLSMRSTIVPEPSLGIDEVGLPEGPAMELYKPFVVAHMVKWHIPPLQAQERMKKMTDDARRALAEVVKERPLLLKRDPSLHKYSIMAFTPKLVSGKAIQIHPLVTGGYGADFDGDTMAATIPISKEAVEEAKKLFPSNNLFSSTSGKVLYSPTQESLLGLHLLSQWGVGKKKSFGSVEELRRAHERGEVELTEPIKLKGAMDGKETTLGRIMIAERLPPGFHKNVDILHNPSFTINKKTLVNDLVTPLAKNHTSDFAKTVDALKDLGNEQSYRQGFSFGLKDLAPAKSRDIILSKAKHEADKVRASTIDQDERDRRVVEIYQKATGELDKAVGEEFAKNPNRLSTMVYSGSRGTPEQFRQMVAAPMLLSDAQNRPVPSPVTRSYSEGLDISDYWISQSGARKGIVQRALGTEKPGGLSKDIVNSMIHVLITKDDCGTKDGILTPLDGGDAPDRYLAKGYKLKDGTEYKAGTIVTPEMVTRMRNSLDEKKILVRSPLKCEQGDGICQKCSGLNENGQLSPLGTNVGVLAAQALGEPATQLAMVAHHEGGLAKGKAAASVDQFTRLEQLLHMPAKLPNEAVLSSATGVISGIKHDPITNGVNIYVGDQAYKHSIPHQQVRSDLKVGDKVTKGSKLSLGVVNPHELYAKTKNINEVQNYLAKALHEGDAEEEGLYKSKGVRRRNIEVAVRAMTNLTKITDPGDSDYLPADVAQRSMVEAHNRDLPKDARPIKHEPIIMGTGQIPLNISPDWLTKLNYQHLHTVIQQAAQMGHRANFHGSSPISGMVLGSEFGHPPNKSKTHPY